MSITKTTPAPPRLPPLRIGLECGLVTLSVFDSEAQRAVFAAVAGSAESILYGARSLPAERLDSVLRDGQLLLSQLPDSAGPR